MSTASFTRDIILDEEASERLRTMPKMTLDQAIDGCLKNSMEELVKGNTFSAKERLQFAEWLIELRERVNKENEKETK